MTIIAWNGEFIAANTKHVRGNMKYNGTKLRLIQTGKDAHIAAWTGITANALELVEWFTNELVAKHNGRTHNADFPRTKGEDNATVIIVSKDECFSCDSIAHGEVKVTAPYCAWGSGDEVAMGAMYMGASPMSAVRAANTHNVYCGGKVEYYDLKTMERYVED